jgi:tripartite ATP-independent transporter DctP family solute receptor
MAINRRHFVGLGLTASAAALTFGTGGPARAQAKLVLKSSDVHPFGYPTVEAVKSMGEKLAKQTNDRITVQIFPSMQLGGEKEMIEQAQVGALAMARVSVGPMGPIVDDLNVFSMPFVFRDIAHMRKVVDGQVGQDMLDRVSNHPRAGLIGLCWMDAGSRNIYNSKHPVRSVADMKGLKIRTMGNPIFVDMVNSLGGNGVAMGFDQLINAMQTGIVDGAENNYPSYANGQHYRYAKHFSQTEHLILPEILVFSKRIWDTLSKDDQALIKKTAREAQFEARTLWDEMEKKALAQMKEAGVEVITFPDKKPFQDAVKPVWDKYGAKYADMVARIQEVK